MDNHSVIPLVCTMCYTTTSGNTTVSGLLTLALVADIAFTIIIMLCVGSREAAVGALLIGAIIAGLLALRRYAMRRYVCSTCGSGELIPVRSPRAELIAWEMEKLESSRPKKQQLPPSTSRTISPVSEHTSDGPVHVPAPPEAPVPVAPSKTPPPSPSAPAPERPTRTLTIDQEKFLADKVAKEDAERFKGAP